MTIKIYNNISRIFPYKHAYVDMYIYVSIFIAVLFIVNIKKL